MINKQGGISSGLFKAGVQHPDDRPESNEETNNDRYDYSWRIFPDYQVYTHHATRNFKPYLLNGLDPRVAQSWLPPGENNEKEIEIYQVTDVQSVWQSEQSDVDRNGGKELSIWRTQAKNGFYSIGSVISRSKTKIGAGILLKVKKDIHDAVRDPMFYTALNTGKARVLILNHVSNIMFITCSFFVKQKSYKLYDIILCFRSMKIACIFKDFFSYSVVKSNNFSVTFSFSLDFLNISIKTFFARIKFILCFHIHLILLVSVYEIRERFLQTRSAGGFWRAHCPINYVSLGIHMTASKDQYPAQGEFYCVHQRYCTFVDGAHKHIFSFNQDCFL